MEVNSFSQAEKPQEQRNDNVSSKSAVNQRNKATRKETQATKESESKKREDLTSLGSDDSGLFTFAMSLQSLQCVALCF